MKTNQPESIKKIVEDVLVSLDQKGRIPEINILLSWEIIVGSQIASHSFPYYLKSGVLTVAVYNSVWMNQLNFFRDDMVKKINHHLKENAVRSIRLVLDKKPDRWPLKTDRTSGASAVSPHDQHLIEQACRTISDLELREIVSRFLQRHVSKECVQKTKGITTSQVHRRKK